MPTNNSTDHDELLDTAADTASNLKDRISDLGQTAADKIDEKRERIAGGLATAARALHTKAEHLPGGDKAAGMAHYTADKLSSTAEYVREHDVRRIMGDVGHGVKNNPVPALIAAGAIGFLAGRLFSNRD
jgi:ElaB/YqjD/DUF883 family membrane-anchored ribosome-binding protein